MEGLTKRGELDKRRDFAVDEGASDGALKILDSLSHDYEKTYGLWFLTKLFANWIRILWM